MYFVFNDNKNNLNYSGDGRPKTMSLGKDNLTTLVTMDSLGNMKRQALFDKDTAEAYALPEMSVQISPKDMVICFQKRSKRRFAKISFE